MDAPAQPQAIGVAQQRETLGRALYRDVRCTHAKHRLEHGLIDEVRMLVHPLTVGQDGRRFDGANATIPLKLVDTQTFASGVVALTHNPQT